MTRQCLGICTTRLKEDITKCKKSPGKNITYLSHKYCTICEIWVCKKKFSLQLRCQCCGNKFRSRKSITEGNKRRRAEKRAERIFIDFFNSIREEQYVTPTYVSSGNSLFNINIIKCQTDRQTDDVCR